MVPILGSLGDLKFVPALLERQMTFDAIISTTEDLGSFETHFQSILHLVQTLVESSRCAGAKPLAIFTFGCKDYGMTLCADQPGLVPSTEDSALNPPAALRLRTSITPKAFNYAVEFDAVIVRPTTIYGRSGSYYGSFFELAAAAAQANAPLRLHSHAMSIVHGTHVDDVAEAYLCIVQAERQAVQGQRFNISSHRYETLREVADALAAEYGIENEVVYEPRAETFEGQFDPLAMLTGFS